MRYITIGSTQNRQPKTEPILNYIFSHFVTSNLLKKHTMYVIHVCNVSYFFG